MIAPPVASTQRARDTQLHSSRRQSTSTLPFTSQGVTLMMRSRSRRRRMGRSRRRRARAALEGG